MHSPAPTAAILIIGNEILSGRTQDINTSWLGHELNLRGIRVREARVVSDDKNAIIKAVRELSAAYDMVFTTGGIGPTHDDITADAMAAAFDVALPVHDEARARLQKYYDAQGKEFNAARLRMARIPQGAGLIDNPVSAAPGFKIKNVYVMAGIPHIMRAMFQTYADGLKGGQPVLSMAITCHFGEGDLSAPLGALQEKYPDVDIGSYPGGGENENEKEHVTIVLRHTDDGLLQKAFKETQQMIEKLSA